MGRHISTGDYLAALEVLDIKPGTSYDEAHHLYREKVKRYHSDGRPASEKEDLDEKLASANVAWDVVEEYLKSGRDPDPEPTQQATRSSAPAGTREPPTAKTQARPDAKAGGPTTSDSSTKAWSDPAWQQSYDPRDTSTADESGEPFAGPDGARPGTGRQAYRPSTTPPSPSKPTGVSAVLLMVVRIVVIVCFVAFVIPPIANWLGDVIVVPTDPFGLDYAAGAFAMFMVLVRIFASIALYVVGIAFAWSLAEWVVDVLRRLFSHKR